MLRNQPDENKLKIKQQKMQHYKITPTLLPLAGLIVGIYVQKISPLSSVYIKLIISSTSIFLGIAFLGRNKLKETVAKAAQLSLMFFLSFGIGSQSLYTQQNKMQQIRQNIINKSLELEGTVISKFHHSAPQIKEIIQLRVSHLKTSFDILCYLKEASYLEIDDKIHLKNITLSAPQKKNISGNQDFQDYLLKEKIAGTYFSQKLSYQLLHRPKFSIKRWLYKKKDSLLESMKEKLSWPALSLYSCIFLGNKKQSLSYLQSSRHLFSYWGISHYLARSGIHLILLILIWKILLGLFPIPFYLKHILLLMFCSTYAALSWSSISFTRAILIFLAYEIGKLLNRQSTLLHLLSLTCFMILLFNPLQLFFLDFQLSFALTFALSYMMKSCKKEIHEPA